MWSSEVMDLQVDFWPVGGSKKDIKVKSYLPDSACSTCVSLDCGVFLLSPVVNFSVLA